MLLIGKKFIHLFIKHVTWTVFLLCVTHCLENTQFYLGKVVDWDRKEKVWKVLQGIPGRGSNPCQDLMMWNPMTFKKNWTLFDMAGGWNMKREHSEKWGKEGRYQQHNYLLYELASLLNVWHPCLLPIKCQKYPHNYYNNQTFYYKYTFLNIPKGIPSWLRATGAWSRMTICYQEITSAGQDVEKNEHLCTVDGM